MEVIIADGLIVICSKQKNRDLFSATIGGMGLTGFIKIVTIKLRRRKGNSLELTTKKFIGLSELFSFFEKDQSEYRIGWIDFMPKIPRGIYYSAIRSSQIIKTKDEGMNLKIPKIKFFYRSPVRILNALRFQMARDEIKTINPVTFQWKTDAVKYWNHLFGSPGFQEYQFVAPLNAAEKTINNFRRTSRKHNLCPSFIVLKRFGKKHSPGLLSFPMEGFTVNPTFEMSSGNNKFFKRFTEEIISVGGQFNLSKDSSLDNDQFQKMYGNIDQWRKIVKKYDPNNLIVSDMSKRLKMKPW